MGDKNDLLLFFDRPTEPCFLPKGEEKALFEIPDHYYPDKYKPVSNTLGNRFGAESKRQIAVRNISLPNIEELMQLPYNSNFSLFVPQHRRLAGQLIDIFMGMRDVDDLKSMCCYCQLRVNPYMFNYCLSVAMLHRDDTKGVSPPAFVEAYPDKFMDPKVFANARKTATTEPTGSRMPLEIPVNFTASDLEPEQRLAYFREDIGINLHHWHWHLVYPFDSANVRIVNKDRRGELFYYMHQQIIARYNVERLCNNLSRVVSLNNFRDPIEEAYFPKLNSKVASRSWPPRFAQTRLTNVNRQVDQIRSDVANLETWTGRFMEAIRNKSIRLPNGRTVPLDEETGIDKLGNMMESSIISPNREYYGNLHNQGHIFIAYSHDPDHRHLEQFGVMGDSATAMRDPVFYRWHSFIDDIFTSYKATLTPYGSDRLDFPGIRLSSVSIQGPGGRDLFSTSWQQSTVNLSRGLDFAPRGGILARFTHLNHTDYNYVLEINNTTGQSAQGTVRIFVAPTVDERGQALDFESQRRMMIELDKFTQPLKPGTNTVTHSSKDSSVTIPFERVFRDQTQRPGEAGTDAAADFDFCGCGWPHHMLIPRGTSQGYPVMLFAMVSNWMEDRVEQDLVGTCNDAASYCGIRDRKYPDKRAMGYPFDRPNPNVSSLRDFMTPNMAVKECKIQFVDAINPRTG